MGKIERSLRRNIGEITVRQLHQDDKFMTRRLSAPMDAGLRTSTTLTLNPYLATQTDRQL